MPTISFMSLLRLRIIGFLILLSCSFAVGADVYAVDTDGDGFDDTAAPVDNCPTVYNPTQRNFDGDAWGDACDDDDDNDDVLDVNDNCDYASNLDQANNDNDPYGDVCDEDDDNDGTLDVNDNCPFKSNANQKDSDTDGVGDVCDDSDSDGLVDASDNCPNVANSDQANMDHDNYGDACDDDKDGDTVPNASDNCPINPNITQSDIDSDGLGDVCDDDIDGDGTLNGSDECPYDLSKQTKGTCGCGFSDEDVDGDGVPACMDNCPTNKYKLVPGTCGCGKNKLEPGLCGCDNKDVDYNENGVCDTAEESLMIRGRVFLIRPNCQKLDKSSGKLVPEHIWDCPRRYIEGVSVNTPVGKAVSDENGEYEIQMFFGDWTLWLDLPATGVNYSKFARYYDFRTVTGRTECQYPISDNPSYYNHDQCDENPTCKGTPGCDANPVCAELQCQSDPLRIDANYMNYQSGAYELTGVDFMLTDCEAGLVKDGTTGDCVEFEQSVANTIKACRYVISADSDGDGVSNELEYQQGTDPCDRGDVLSEDQGPLYSKYNTFLDQENYLELLSTGEKTAQTLISFYGPGGKQVGKTRKVTIEPGKQIDISINQIVGKSNSFGLVKVEYNRDEDGVGVSGRVSVYRKEDVGDNYSYAFARELAEAQLGNVYAIANTDDPEGLGNIVENWLEIVNLEKKTQKFSVNIFDEKGNIVAKNGKAVKGRSRKAASSISVKGLGEVDMQAGHEFGAGRYLVEVKPANKDARYFLNLTRYGARIDSDNNTADLYFGSAIPGGYGGTTEQYVVANNLKGEGWSQANWLEIANVSEEEVEATLAVYTPNGEKRLNRQFVVKPHAVENINVGIVLPTGTAGIAEIKSSIPASLFVDSYVFYTDNDNGNVQTAYVDSPVSPREQKQTTSVNTFLGMKNYLGLFNLESSVGGFEVKVKDQYGKVRETRVLTPKPYSAQLLEYAKPTLSVPENSYGLVEIRPYVDNSFAGKTIRVREVNKEVDFAMPIAVK